MKKLVLVVTLVFALISVARAETLSIGDTLKSLPTLKQGVAYSLTDSTFSYLTTTELFGWKNITLEAGYSSKDKIVAVVSYPILKLKDLGVTVPILDLIECNIGLYTGYGSINMQEIDRSEIDYGISATLISIKF